LFRGNIATGPICILLNIVLLEYEKEELVQDHGEIMITNLIRNKLQKGNTVFGPFFTYPDPQLAEFIALLEWDFIVFDAEHSSLTPLDIENFSRACELRSVTPLVRTPGREIHMVNRFLDAGAHGVMFPMINSGIEAHEAIQAVKYPPLGNRGLAAPRASDFLLKGRGDEYIIHANKETLIMIQVETKKAVDALDEILLIDEIDIVFLGPTDLSTDLGLCEQLEHPKVKGLIDYVSKSVVESGKILGTFAPSFERARYVRDELGARFIVTDLGMHIADGCRIFLDNIRNSSLS
jgi:4-hydroxy-2-oxoheptanedioate aldolase